jgi:hypothetical protein
MSYLLSECKFAATAEFALPQARELDSEREREREITYVLRRSSRTTTII